MQPAKNNIDSNYAPAKDSSKKAITVAVFGFFIGFGLLFFLFPLTLINFFKLSQFYIGFTVIGLIVPLRFYQKWFQFIKYEMILFNILGAGPMLTSLFLLSNLLITTNEQTINYKIIGCKISGQTIELKLNSEIEKINPKITTMSDVNMEEFITAKSIDITLAKGIFGLMVIKDRSFK